MAARKVFGEDRELRFDDSSTIGPSCADGVVFITVFRADGARHCMAVPLASYDDHPWQLEIHIRQAAERAGMFHKQWPPAIPAPISVPT